MSIVFILLSLNVFSQDLYTANRVVKMELEFYDSNYLQLLEQNKEEEIEIPAKLIVDDELVLDSVGVRYKGNSSYKSNGSKKSFNITIDEYIDGQDLWGYESLNLNNAFLDPTFMREYITNKVFGRYMPALKTGYVSLYVNGAEFGLYSNVQQINKDYLGQWYNSKSGNLYKGDPRGELTWQGDNPDLYKDDYLKKTNEDDVDWSDLVELINVINNSSEIEDSLPEVLDTDRVLWYFALCNIFVNLDSYIFSSHNYFVYNDPADNRFDFLLWDVNESFGVFPPNLPFSKTSFPPIDLNAPNRTPLLKKMLINPYFQSVYFAHYRTILRESFCVDSISRLIEEIKPVIDTYVQKDPMKLYTYQDFENNINDDVSVGNRIVPGLLSFVEARNEYLTNLADLTKAEPIIGIVVYPYNDLKPNNKVVFRVRMETEDTKEVVFHWRIGDGRFFGIEMNDKGYYPDVEPDDNFYGVAFEIPDGSSGMKLCCYVTAVNDQDVMKFYPERAEFEFISLKIESSLSNTDIVINEFMADNETTILDPQGENEDWIELYNKSDQLVSLNGWYLTDDAMESTKWQFPDVSIEPNGYLLIWADEDIEDEGLHADIKLSKSGEYIGLYDDEQNLIDAYTFGEQKEDVTEGRYPNGDGEFDFLEPTPGSENKMPSSVEYDPINNGLYVYPNPATDYIFVRISENIGLMNNNTLKVFNPFGEVVYSEVIDLSLTDHKLSIFEFPTGVYYVIVGEYVERFVKLR